MCRVSLHILSSLIRCTQWYLFAKYEGSNLLHLMICIYYIHYVSTLALICVALTMLWVIFVTRFLLVDQYSEQISIIKIKLLFLTTYSFNCVHLISTSQCLLVLIRLRVWVFVMFNDVCIVSVRQIRSCIRPHIKWSVSMVTVWPL